MIIKRWIAIVMAGIICLCMMPVEAFATKYSPPFEVDAEGVYLMNIDTGEVIYEKNADKRMSPSALTQIMTTIVALDEIADPANAQVKMKAYVQDYMYIKNRSIGIQLGGFLNGETISLDKLLYAVMIQSANEAAMMVADYVGDGSVDYFVELMNDKAKELGAQNTKFTNAHGIYDEGQYTTPYDMYLIAQYAMENPQFAKMAATISYNGGPTNKHDELLWHNTNSTINKSSSYYASYFRGVKAVRNSEGRKAQAGSCLVSMATKDGYNYMLVVMGGNTQRTDELNAAFVDSKKLYEWVFSTFKVKTVMDRGEIIGETKLRLSRDGKKDHLKLMSGERLSALIPDDIDVSSVTMVLEIPGEVNAPVKRGDHIGFATFTLAGSTLGRVPVIAAENVELHLIKSYIDQGMGLLRSFWFKFLLLFVVIFYISLLIILNRRKKQRKKIG